MSVVRVNGIRLYYERRGTGAPVLVIPGIATIVSDYRSLVDGLAAAFDVVVYDNRGSGASDKPDEPYSMPLLASDAAGLLRALGIERAHVIGFAMGGLIAQHLALEFPHLVSRLVLACTHAGTKSFTRPSREVGRAFQSPTEDWAKRMQAFARYACAPDFAAREPERYAAFVRKKSADVEPFYAYRRQLEATLGYDTYDLLPAITTPTLVITGAADAIVPAANSRVLAERIPHARLVVIEGAGHFFFAERPAETMRALREFLL